MDIVVFEDLKELGRRAIESLSGKSIAISGGSTFEKLFDIWQSEEKLKEFDFFPVDERLVPFENEACNWRVATEKLFIPLGMESQKEHWAQSKEKLEELLSLSLQGGTFDHVFLGMGDDGHTASLFPKGEYLTDATSLTLETESPKAPVNRVTLGFKPIWEAKKLTLIVLGKNKQKILQRVLEGDESLPITLALKGHPKPLLLLDKDAAGK